MIQKPRGTADIFPKDITYWHYIEEKAREVAKKYGFGEIRFPTFESTELFSRGVGDTTDVVQKEMYTFLDREGRSFTLRPEGTACVARALVENGKCSDAMPLKYYYIINCFRYEKPQAGRSREFFQFGTEMYGAATPLADAEVICLADSFIKELGISNVKLNINSIGCPECRKEYHKALKEYFTSKKEELCHTCLERLEKNPMRILDCKSEICSKIAEGAPVILDYLCGDCKEHFEKLKKHLDSFEIGYTVNPRIVRGLDYYTRTVFEFVCDAIGAQGTVCGGGRYDGLMKEIGGPSLPGIGFAMGISRLILAMKACGKEIEDDSSPILYVAPMGENATVFAAKLVKKLRDDGIYAETDIVSRSVKAQMKYADKIGAKFTVVIGDNELECGKVKLKNMAASEEKEVELANIVDELKKM